MASIRPQNGRTSYHSAWQFTRNGDPNPKPKPPSRLSFSSFANSYSVPGTAAASLSASAAVADWNKPIVVVGSANADIYVEIDRLPKEGETVAARTGQTLAGGKGANQACCTARLAHPTYFVGQIGDDAHGHLIENALRRSGVRLDHLARIAAAPTGHAVVMLQPDGQNSIIIVGGTNMCWWPEAVRGEDLNLVRTAGVVLLQREIPDRVNIEVAKAAKNAGVPVIIDAGGVEDPIPTELIETVDILSPNETELGRLTRMPTDTFEQINQASKKCHEMGAKQVLVKLGSKGSALFINGEEPIRQPIIPASKVVDTTGAGDTFTAAFAVALVEGMTRKDCLEFAAAAASLCVQVKGAMPSMPERKGVLELLQSLKFRRDHASL
ncbi:Putative fructokinase-5 [Apostasia shenzhenica]|uniref:Ribokinase n=1 Tax=Apostasia shenzhenica TaxID=1088818 RepID=A0A2H9ZZL3_9ASPA|nr:Putative fructokinase-5 [Apostasia shenzhenica]